MKKYIASTIGVLGLLTLLFVLGISYASPVEAVDVPTETEYLLNRVQERQEEWHTLNEQYKVYMASGALLKAEMDKLSNLNNTARKHIQKLEYLEIPEEKVQFLLSRYYTPVRGQPEYYSGSYEEDYRVNCMGDCLSTASTKILKSTDAYAVLACPKEYPFGTKFIINEHEFTCWDRGGAIKKYGKVVRLDIWAGVGMAGLNNIKSIGVPHKPVVRVIYP